MSAELRVVTDPARELAHLDQLAALAEALQEFLRKIDQHEHRGYRHIKVAAAFPLRDAARNARHLLNGETA